MMPTIGRIVIYREGAHEPTWSDGTNGTREHPAIITRVWSERCVNLMVFFDAHEVKPRCSVLELPALPNGVADVSGNAGWHWPDRPAASLETAKAA